MSRARSSQLCYRTGTSGQRLPQTGQGQWGRGGSAGPWGHHSVPENSRLCSGNVKLRINVEQVLDLCGRHSSWA